MFNFIIITFFVFLNVPAMLMTSFGGFVLTPKRSRKILIIYTLGVSLLAYCYLPIGTTDLYRYLNIIETCGTMSLTEAIKWCGDGLYISNFVFWLAGSIKMPTIATMISVGVVYGVSAYIAIDSAELFLINRKTFALIMYDFAILHFFYLANNMRNVCAFSLAVLAAYRECIKGKKDILTWILYIMPCFIHRTGVIIIFIRLLVIVAKKSIAICILAAVMLPSIIVWIYNHLNYIPVEWGRRFIQSGYAYTNTTSKWARIVQNSGYQRANKLVWGILLVLMIIVGHYIYKYIEKNNFVLFSELLGVLSLTVLLIVRDDTYWRFSSAAAISFTYAFAILIKRYNSLNLFFKVIISLFVIVCVGEELLQIWFDRYMVNWGSIFSDAMLTNFFVVLGKVFLGIARQ